MNSFFVFFDLLFFSEIQKLKNTTTLLDPTFGKKGFIVFLKTLFNALCLTQIPQFAQNCYFVSF